MASSEIELYLERPPYYGRSHARDNAIVKPLCGPTAKFDGERKMWTTRCEDALRALVASDRWRPVGIEPEDYALLMNAAEERRAKAEVEWKAEQERLAAERAARQKVAEEKAARQRATEEKAAKKRAAEEKAVAEREAKRRKQEQAEAKKKAAKKPPEKKRDGLEPTAAEVAECKRLGFTEQAIAHSQTLNELGPRGSLSDEGRLLRYCFLVFEHDEPVPELTREERRASWSYECRWPLADTADSRKYAAKLNCEAAEAAQAQ